jgi:hypothetical protein
MSQSAWFVIDEISPFSKDMFDALEDIIFPHSGKGAGVLGEPKHGAMLDDGFWGTREEQGE